MGPSVTILLGAKVKIPIRPAFKSPRRYRDAEQRYRDTETYRYRDVEI